MKGTMKNSTETILRSDPNAHLFFRSHGVMIEVAHGCCIAMIEQGARFLLAQIEVQLDLALLKW